MDWWTKMMLRKTKMYACRRDMNDSMMLMNTPIATYGTAVSMEVGINISSIFAKRKIIPMNE